MTNGAQAETYANYFIGRHLFLIGGGMTYSLLSAAPLAQPKNTASAAQVQIVFRGTTLAEDVHPQCGRELCALACVSMSGIQEPSRSFGDRFAVPLLPARPAR